MFGRSRVRQILLRLAMVGAAVAIALLGLRLTIFRAPLVSVAAVGRGTVADEVEGTGTVTADVLANVASKIGGRVDRVYADEGDFVKKGQVLANLDQGDLEHQVEQARAQLASTQETAAEQQREAKRRQILVSQGQLAATVEEAQQFTKNYLVAQRSVEAAEANLRLTEYTLSLAQIPSLVDGVVTKRAVNVGDAIVPGEQMFTVADTQLIYVNANLDQNLTGRVKKSAPATVLLRGREEHPLPGYVLRISPQADASTEEMVAEVAFSIPASEFQLGQWANVFITDHTAQDALIVPRTALMPAEEHSFVLVVDSQDRIRREPVTVLAKSPRDPRVAVAGNLAPGERVAVNPMGLASGEAVRVASAAQSETSDAPR